MELVSLPAVWTMSSLPLPSVLVCVWTSFSYKDTVILGEGVAPVASSRLSLQAQTQSCVPGASACEFEGDSTSTVSPP
jgi:hypothetical protein